MFVSVSVGEFVCVAVRELVFVSMHGTVWVLLYMSVHVAVRVLVSEPLCMVGLGFGSTVVVNVVDVVCLFCFCCV